jgi:inner membrane protein
MKTLAWFASDESYLVKLLFIVSLILFMLIPLNMVGGLISERQQFNQDVTKDIVQKWGGEQIIKGPILIIPYLTKYKSANNEISETVKYLYSVPEALNIKAKVASENRHVGIYDVNVYNTNQVFEGRFPRLTLPAVQKEIKEAISQDQRDHDTSALLGLALPVQDSDIRWEEALIGMGVEDRAGFLPNQTVLLAGKKLVFTKSENFQGLKAAIKQSILDKSLPFKIEMALHGSRSLNFVPIAKSTKLMMSSNWGDPSFKGSFLPIHHVIQSNGFNAEWFVPNFSESDKTIVSVRNINSIFRDSQQFGVSLIKTVDFYQQISRTIKYGVLTLTLTFLTFFLIEVIAGVSFHFFQYILVGAALSLFYLLLLALSEVFGYAGAYGIASLAIIGLITYYTSGFVQKIRHLIVITFVLLGLFSYIYVLMQLETFSLLFGSIGLFIGLAILMGITRRVNWQKKRAESSTQEV